MIARITSFRFGDFTLATILSPLTRRWATKPRRSAVSESPNGTDNRDRKRRRVRRRSTRLRRLGKWWEQYNHTVLLWGGFVLTGLVLIVLVLKGCIRAPSPQPP